MTPINSSQGLRHPRIFFEKKLRKILERVSKGEWVDFHWKEFFVLRGDYTGRAKATALWVVGSFARGAEYCGDLDLVLCAEEEYTSFRASGLTVSKALVGAPPYVRTYVGTPEENSSYASFDDAVLLWSKEQPDWEKALAGIKVSPDAGRHEREWDEIPLRMEQICIADPDKMLELKKSGVIDWQWFEWDALAAFPLIEKNVPKKRLDFIKSRRASKYSQCLDLAAKWLSHREYADSWDLYGCLIRKEMPITIGGHALTISPMPGLWLSYLDDPTCHTVLIMPYKTKRGPNGMWAITRGPNHPAVQKRTS
ncbi:hypothetical protein FY034_17690 (plasmid) [Trichlorobacter lovleyi]|uniref:hypothetical protein n=1 Tax=Trichlorobacter lovleyi TaxID=313985 RepID=UPI002240DD33|nr:hypothetical protein [Trichlorobacter lovleyi]QOX80857.1 hypothetical protein FY034_17690 [Trichlorobacter lovleyi]